MGYILASTGYPVFSIIVLRAKIQMVLRRDQRCMWQHRRQGQGPGGEGTHLPWSRQTDQITEAHPMSHPSGGEDAPWRQMPFMREPVAS